ncbi:MAG: hypothetical protein KBG15_05800 [Kofleriaceae bacterium]|nr:hypothetical protein [Kofleriaceae bacterium]
MRKRQSNRKLTGRISASGKNPSPSPKSKRERAGVRAARLVSLGDVAHSRDPAQLAAENVTERIAAARAEQVNAFKAQIAGAAVDDLRTYRIALPGALAEQRDTTRER